MELLIFVAGLCLLSVLALRFGVDSRPRTYSPEEDYARLGLTWDAAQQHAIDLRREAEMWRLTQQAAPRRQRQAALTPIRRGRWPRRRPGLEAS